MLFLPFLLLCFAVSVQAQDDLPVEIGFESTGGETPGSSATIMATVTANDNSTVSGYNWTQVSGPEVSFTGQGTDSISFTVPSLAAHKEQLLLVLTEPPIGEDELPPGVPVPEGEFVGGLQNRFQVVGMSHFALEETLVGFAVEVTTSSGTYNSLDQPGESSDRKGVAHTEIPWKVATSLRNVPLGRIVMLQGVEQETYDWNLVDTPNGSMASLTDATTRNPEFTPDVAGVYTVQVTDESDMSVVELEIYSDQWRGVIVGQDSEGFPVSDPSCTGCHSGSIAPDTFTPWSKTGHAEIFTTNLTTSPYWGPQCFDCHTVGYDLDVDNGAIDDQSDYQAFLDDPNQIGAQNPDAWANMLNDYPDSAQLANIQCENCHGPQGAFASDAHGAVEGAPRVSLSSDVCATCHGEPLRHARFQQWQLSQHSNYELAIDEGDSGNCSRCHTANGFLAWLPVLLDDDPETDPLESVEVTWESDDVHPQTCVTCHDPHNAGTTSGNDTDANIYISGDTPPLIAGFTAMDVGNGAMCMTCHNTRRGLRNESNWATTTDRDRAPHPGAQTDVLMGQNAYLTAVGIRGAHSNRDAGGLVEDTCVTCHMQETPPPDVLAYNSGGANHTFYAEKTICSECHEGAGDDFADVIQGPIIANMAVLHSAIIDSYEDLFAEIFDGGGTVTVGDTVLSSTMDYTEIQLGESRGRQALNLVLADASETGLNSLASIDVTPSPSTPGAPKPLTEVASDELLKSGWNYFLVEADGSHGVHNPSFAGNVVDKSIAALGGEAVPCTEDANTICLNDSRFEVSVDWRSPPNFPDLQGATVSNLRTADSGIFYFVNPDNLEFLLKVVDGCSLNDNYWVFFAATTNVEFTVTVRDTMRNVSKTYMNPLGQPANAVTDTTAFATCP